MSERRNYGRVPYFCRLKIETLHTRTASEAFCVDIGLGGIGLATALRLESGQTVRISFYLNVGGKPIVEEAVGEVRIVRYDDWAVRAGIEFTNPLNRTRNPELIKAIERI